jgi:N-acetylneuraminic acid mutarotase
MYLPSDFFGASFLWNDVFPHHRPFELGNACQFHIMEKGADNPFSNEIPDIYLDPPDADYRFSAKVTVYLILTAGYALVNGKVKLCDMLGDRKISEELNQNMCVMGYVKDVLGAKK